MNENQLMEITPSILEADYSLLRDAPEILCELRRLQVQKEIMTAESFVAQLTEILANYASEEERLIQLMEEGKFAVVEPRLSDLPKELLNIIGIERRDKRENWLGKCNLLLEQIQTRLRLQQAVLKDSEIQTIHNRVDTSKQLIAEKWFNLAEQELKLADQELKDFYKNAIKERQERFDTIQDLIQDIRRDYISYEAIMENHGTIEASWELMNYADRLSASSEDTFDQIVEIASAIRHLYQGGRIDEKTHNLLTHFQTRFDRPQLHFQTSINLGTDVSAEANGQPGSKPDALPKRRILSEAVRAFLEEYLRSDSSLIYLQLSETDLPDGYQWNEEFVNKILGKMRHLGYSKDTTRENVVLLRSYLLFWIRYWAEKRKQAPRQNEVNEISEQFVNLLCAQADSFLENSSWEAACEFYRIAFGLRAIKTRGLSYLEDFALNYFSGYAFYKPASALYSPKELERLAGKELKGLTTEEIIRLGLRIGLASDVDGKESRLALSLIRLGAENPDLLATINRSLENAVDLGDNLSRAIEQIGRQVGYSGNARGISQLPDLVEEYQQYRRDFINSLELILQATGSFETIVDLPMIISDCEERLGSGRLIEPTDLELFGHIIGISRNLPTFFNKELAYHDREQIVSAVLEKHILVSLNIIARAPNELGELYYRPICENLQTLFEDSLAELRRVSMPRLEVSLLKSEWRSDDRFYCHLQIENQGDTRAENIEILVGESELGAYQPLGKEHHLLALNPGKQHAFHVQILPTTDDAFTLDLQMRYQIPQEWETEFRVSRLRVGAPTAKAVEFEPIQDPYVVGNIVEDEDLFVGREDFIQDLLEEVTNDRRTGSVVIYGQKRSGKSSILYHLKKRVPDKVIAILCDINSIITDLPKIDERMTFSERHLTEMELLGRLFFSLSREICQQAQEYNVDVDIWSYEQFLEAPGPGGQFRAFLEQFQQKGRFRLLILLDEFQALVDKIDEEIILGSILKLFKSLIERGYFSCVISGLSEVYETVERFANQLAVSRPRQVDYLDRRSAYRLIDEPIRIGGPTGPSRYIPESVIDEIYELTAGSPYYIQMFCSSLVHYMNEMEFAEITAADINKMRQALVSGDETIPPVNFDNLYTYLSGRGRNAILEGLIMPLVAHETATKTYASRGSIFEYVKSFVTEEDFDKTLLRLEQRGSIIAESDDPSQTQKIDRPFRSRQYRIRVDLFRQWLIANRPIDEAVIARFKRELKKSD